jgi:predicted O-methyltransferase YrrM
MAIMLTAPEQAALMTVIVRAIGASRALELGTFTGYGAISIARGLPDDGVLITCDVSEEWTSIGRRYWTEAGLADRIDLRLGPAAETLARISPDPPFDFAFIDADKENYDAYYEASLELVRQGGLIAIDNVLWSGAVADPRKRDADTEALRALNLKLRDDQRVDISMLPIGDGLTLARIR